jgi:hypothetical protein
LREAHPVRSERSCDSSEVEERVRGESGAFDFPFDKLRVRSGRTEIVSTASEEVYESHAVRFSMGDQQKRAVCEIFLRVAEARNKAEKFFIFSRL